MKLKFCKSLLPAQDGAAKVLGVCWSHNNKKLAVCTADRVILLFDEKFERRDKFATKPVDPKFGKKSYIIKGMAFSPDSTRLAVGQSDQIVYVYRIGENWGEKKVISNKFHLSEPLTCMIWPHDGPLIHGLMDGKVRAAHVRTNKSVILLNHDSCVVSLAHSCTGKAVISGHFDGSIVRFLFEEESKLGEFQGRLVTHSCPPSALVWTAQSIIAAGSDLRVVMYGHDGTTLQAFEYAENERDFTVGVCNATGCSAVIASFDKLRLYNWDPETQLFEEGCTRRVKNWYSVMCMAWKRDGSKLAVGTLCGGVDIFDCHTKRSVYHNRFEVRYVGPKQVIVKDLESPALTEIKSKYGYDIMSIKISSKDTHIIAYTVYTLLLVQIEGSLSSEIAWHGIGGQEKFNFDTEGVCLIFNKGELSVVEYGQNVILGSVRTDFTNPHLISVRVNDHLLEDGMENKKLAYLIDLKTICVLDLLNGDIIQQTTHRSRIDWLELNESAKKLLFRDKKQRLTLLDVGTGEKTTMLTYCTFVQWVPLSDVVVAQTRNSICVWYNIDFTDRVTQLPVQGEVVDLVRGGGKTDVIVNDGIDQLAIPLDDVRIEFVNSLSIRDYSRALTYVEELELTEASETMWSTLAQLAVDKKMLHLAERCYAGMLDVSKSRFLLETIAMVEEPFQESEAIGSEETLVSDSDETIESESVFDQLAVKARLALLNKDLKLAEYLYLREDKVKETILMYQKAHKWKEAIRTAEERKDSDVEELKKLYFQWLTETGQDEKAGEFKELEGDYYAAVDLYLKAGLPARAAKLVSSVAPLDGDNDQLVQTIASSLMKGEFYEHAGDLYEKMNNFHKALECYRLGNAFGRAVELARTAFPEEVIHLEEEWGDHLVSIKQPDAAANHFLESGANIKALDAAIASRQWKKAAQIIEIIDNPSKVMAYYPKMANHYLSVAEYELAEHFFVEGGMHKEAMDMYSSIGEWEKAHKLATHFLPADEVTRMYISQAEKLEQEGKLRDAEKLFISVGEPDRAVAMYRNHKKYENMMWLIEKFNPTKLQDAHLLLAKELEGEGNFKLAEHYYLTGEEWKSAVNMYRNLDMWEDAYEVAKRYGTPIAAKQVAYLWAKSLGGESAIKLLTKFGLLESAIDYASENCAFEFAFDLASSSLEAKLPDIHLKNAMFLEDEGKFQEAEIEFIKAGRPKEAVLMYVHQQNWECAQRVAEAHDKDSVAEVLVGQARFAFEKGKYQKAESLLLRAQRSDMAVKFYKDAKMWTEALRVCKDYLPAKFPDLQEEYEAEMAISGNKDPDQLIVNAMQWEDAGQFAKAVDCYSQASEKYSNNYDALERCWTKAVELSWRFLGRQQTEELINEVAPKLVSIKRYTAAASAYLKVNMIRKAVDALLYGEEWSKAKRVAKEYDNRLEEYVDQCYKDALQAQGKTDQLAVVDVIAALDCYAEKQNWKKCLEVAERQGSKVLQKYVALCAADLIREGRVDKALKLYCEYGTPACEQNYNIYQHIADAVLDSRDLNSAEAFRIWANLRDMMHDLVKNLEKNNGRGKDVFDELLLVAHYGAVRSACLGQPTLDKQAAKISVSLLRHITVVPADKAFYEAGLAAKNIGWEDMAFLFWNHYLDVCEAIEEEDPDKIDNTLFAGTDIPVEFPVPGKLHVTSREHDVITDWILSVSMEQILVPPLPVDERMVYEASLVANGEWSPPCIITGYPVLRNKLEFKDSDRVANKDDWNKFLMAAKVSQSGECQDVLKFITRWCGGTPNLSYSFQ